ncbi:MAG: glycosyltransferase, partial [Chthoniobacterales bacterium]|nr:glycosyltransferase [Chthoniobacterales bacterium]
MRSGKSGDQSGSRTLAGASEYPKLMRVAFVVQRCGTEVNGGAEAHCLQIAQRMSAHWQTEVLTTCALDYMTWENHYPPGPQMLGGTTIRRFAVDRPRDVESFNRLSGELHARLESSTIEEQENWMRAQGPISSPLLDYLISEQQGYDAFVFFGYLYATTHFGLPLVQEKALLAPLAHDEWPIYFRMWDDFFARPRRFIFNTRAERQFLRRRFPQLSLDGPVVGVGIEPPARVQPQAFARKYGLRDPFLLYVGRIDASKGCAEMFEWFVRFRSTTRAPRKLVLIGSEVLPVPFHDDIIYLGFVEEAEKWNAMAACDWLLVPSPHESLSMVLLETWAVGRPAIVNAQAEVLK